MLIPSTDIIRLTRVCTYRQLDHWDRLGIVEPSMPARGSGSQRAYSLNEAVALAVVAAVSRDGGTLPSGAVDACAAGTEFVALLPGWSKVRPRLVPVDDNEPLGAVGRLLAEDPAVTLIAAGRIRREIVALLGSAEHSIAAA